jgi:hypothetical protein
MAENHKTASAPPPAADPPKRIIPDWLRPFWYWLFYHPLLLLEAILLLAVVWGCFGVKFGAPYLFWAEEPRMQFLAAFGATWLLGKLCFVGYLLDANADWMKPNSKPRSLWWYLTVTWAPLLVFGLGIRLLIPASGTDSFASAFNAPPDNAGYLVFLERHVPFMLGIVIGAVTAILIVLLLGKLQTRFLTERLLRLPALRSQLPREVSQYVERRERIFVPSPLRKEVPEDVQLHALAATFFGLLLAIYLFLVFSAWTFAWITPALAFCIMLGLVADVYGFISFHFPQAVYPVALLVILAGMLASLAADKHRLPELDYANRQPLDTASYEARRKQDCGLLKAEVLDRWLAYYREHQAASSAEKPKLVVVAASGGGIRSAFWTAVVLNEMEKLYPGFFYHVRLITGASGGMLGAAHFTAKLDALQQFDQKNGFRGSGPEDDAQRRLVDRRNQLLQELKIVDNLEKGGLAPVAQYWVLRDVPRGLCPFPYVEDRGWALEEAWRENFEGALNIPVRSLAKGESDGWRPSLVFAPMMVEDGRRLLISNLDLDSITRAEGSLYTRSDGIHQGLYSLSAVEFFRLFPGANEFKLSSAVRMNASFPYISPVAALPTQPPRRVVDAGYYDNYGIDVAACWLHENHDWIDKHTSGVLLVQIRDAVSQAARTDVRPEEKYGARPWWQRGLQEFTTPPEGAYSALMASMSFRNDEQLRMLSDRFTQNSQNKGRLTTVVIECPVQAELNWSLTQAESKAIRAGVAEQVTDKMRDILNEYNPAGEDLQRKNRNRMEGVKGLLQSK